MILVRNCRLFGDACAEGVVEMFVIYLYPDNVTERAASHFFCHLNGLLFSCCSLDWFNHKEGTP